MGSSFDGSAKRDQLFKDPLSAVCTQASTSSKKEDGKASLIEEVEDETARAH